MKIGKNQYLYIYFIGQKGCTGEVGVFIIRLRWKIWLLKTCHISETGKKYTWMNVLMHLSQTAFHLWILIFLMMFCRPHFTQLCNSEYIQPPLSHTVRSTVSSAEGNPSWRRSQGLQKVPMWHYPYKENAVFLFDTILCSPLERCVTVQGPVGWNFNKI